jgi:predicted DsbA family dithiol-disulfide isomerase
MELIVYGDFNCPYSCLASALSDRLIQLGRAKVEWRAVEHDPTIPIPSPPVDGEAAAMFDRELNEVRAQPGAGEQFPIRRPTVRSNTSAAIATFAATRDHEKDALRRRLFAAYWYEGWDIADPAALKSLAPSCTSSDAQVANSWREAWRGLGRTTVPMLVLPDGYVSRGLGALARLAALVLTPSTAATRHEAH